MLKIIKQIKTYSINSNNILCVLFRIYTVSRHYIYIAKPFIGELLKNNKLYFNFYIFIFFYVTKNFNYSGIFNML